MLRLVDSDEHARMDDVVKAYLQDAGAPGYRNQMAAGLRLIARTLTYGASDDIYAYPWTDVTPDDVRGFQQTMLKRGAQPGSVNVYTTALRGVLREAVKRGALAKDHYDRIAGVPSLYEDRSRRPGKPVDNAMLAALFRACADDRSFAGRRDEALLTLLYAGGLKMAEISELQVGDYDPNEGVIHKRPKGTSYLSLSAVSCLSQYLSALAATLDRDAFPADATFLVPVSGDGHPALEAELDGKAMELAVQRRCRQARIPRLAPGDLRKAHLDELEDALRYVQRQIQIPYVLRKSEG